MPSSTLYKYPLPDSLRDRYAPKIYRIEPSSLISGITRMQADGRDYYRWTICDARAGTYTSESETPLDPPSLTTLTIERRDAIPVLQAVRTWQMNQSVDAITGYDETPYMQGNQNGPVTATEIMAIKQAQRDQLSLMQQTMNQQMSQALDALQQQQMAQSQQASQWTAPTWMVPQYEFSAIDELMKTTPGGIVRTKTPRSFQPYYEWRTTELKPRAAPEPTQPAPDGPRALFDEPKPIKAKTTPKTSRFSSIDFEPTKK